MKKTLHCIIKTFLCQGPRALILLQFLLLGSLNVYAQGDLLVSPKRVIFDDQKRSQDINLANIGKDTARYAVSFLQIRMKEDGSFEEITQPDSGQYFSNKHLRIFPRIVTLAPNEAQIVKVQVLRSDKLTAGEYRSHLYFRALPKETPLGVRSKLEDTTALSIRLTPIYGISIPIIIRSGESTTQVNLTHLELNNSPEGKRLLNLRFNRYGNTSVYGDITVEHISIAGTKTQVGLIKGISVYTPNRIRNVKIKLNNEAGINYHSGKLNVLYTKPAEERSEKLASAELILN